MSAPSRARVLPLLPWLLLPPALAAPAAAAEPLVLGMSAAFTGPSRGLSIELYRGSKAYFDHVNQDKGIHGREIVIKAYDDGYNPVPAIKNTIKLIDQDDVFLLFDYMGSPTVTRMLPLLPRRRDRSMYLFFPFTGAEPPRQRPYEDYVFNLRASYYRETAGLVKNLVRVNRQRIAVFYQLDAYGRSGWDGVRGTLATTGLHMVAEATYKRGTSFAESFQAQVEILRQADPDAVISIATYEAAAGFIRDARDAGWDVPIANVSGVDSENLLALLLDRGRATGPDYARNLIFSEVVPNYRDPVLPAAKEYRELMDRHRPAPPPDLLDKPYAAPPYSFISFEGYLNARLLVEILKKMGPDLRRENIKKVVESLDKVDLGINEPVSFGPDKHQGLNKVYFTVVKGGEFVSQEDWLQWRK
jgi:ABC-type branched-subunit amino acid transport system substrate-binding protein